MKGKVAVITGATSGIGAVAAEKLAAMGARIVFVARNPNRAEKTLARLKEVGPAAAHRIHYADLSRPAHVKRVAEEIVSAEPLIDVLINNAGAVVARRELTDDGLERTFATNHMSYFVLTQSLLNPLKAAAPSRIVNTASDAHLRVKFDFSNLQFEKRYRGFDAYCSTKLYNILFTRELARHLKGTGVTANCLHPGFVATRLGDDAKGIFRYIFRIAKTIAISPERGAETIVYLASSNDVRAVTGEYFYKCKPKTPSLDAQNDAAARQLWEKSEKLSVISH